MKKLRKIGLVAAAGAFVLSAALGFAACGGGGDTIEVASGTSTTLKTDKAPVCRKRHLCIFAKTVRFEKLRYNHDGPGRGRRYGLQAKYFEPDL